MNDEVDRADVNAELERSGRNYGTQLAAAQTPFDVEAKFARQTAVVRHDEAVAEALVEREGDTLAHAARADEDQRRAVIANLLGDAVVDFAPHLLACHRPQLVGGNENVEFHRAAMSDVDDERIGTQETCDFLDRPHGSRESDSLRTAAAGTADQIFQTRQRKR